MNKLESKSGFVNILGVPNSGKSTLINKLVGKKVSIVSHKVQTTRFCIRGICTYLFEDLSKSQIILIDTPGIFPAKRRLDKAMVSAAWSELKHSDKVIFIHDVSKSIENNSLNVMKEIFSKIANPRDIRLARSLLCSSLGAEMLSARSFQKIIGNYFMES